jgi:hypothetical protein
MSKFEAEMQGDVGCETGGGPLTVTTRPDGPKVHSL